jgi:hypothetical protein
MKIIHCILFFFTCFTSVGQQAWTRQKKSYYTQIGWTPDKYDGVIPDDGSKVVLANRILKKTTIDGYIEYGILDNLMFTSSLPFVVSSSTKIGDSITDNLADGKLAGFSNIELGLTYRFVKKNGFVFSGKLNNSLPTATFKEAVGLRTGNKAWSFEPSLLVGFGSSRFFASAEVGAGLRSNNYSSQTLINAQIGKIFGKKKRFTLILNTVNRISNRNGSYLDVNNKVTGFFLNDLTYLVLGLKAGFAVTPKISIWVNVRGTTPGAKPRNIGEPSAALPAYSISISYKK